MEFKPSLHLIKHPAIVLDSHHNVIGVNQTVTEMLSKSEDEIKGKKCYELFHKTSSPPEGCPMRKTVHSGNFESEEMPMEAFGDTFLVTCTPIHSDEGHLTQVLHISQKIFE